jgi:hypothetical protein
LFLRYRSTRSHPNSAAAEIAHHLIVGADLCEAFVERLRPAGGRITLFMPVLLKLFASAIAPSLFRVSTIESDFGGGTMSSWRLIMLAIGSTHPIDNRTHPRSPGVKLPKSNQYTRAHYGASRCA